MRLSEQVTPKENLARWTPGREPEQRAILALQRMAERDPEAVKEAIPKLVTLLADGQGPVHQQALYALVNMSRNSANLVRDSIPRLTTLLDDRNEVCRGDAAFVLGVVGRNDASVVKDAIPILIRLLDDKSRVVRVHATGALGRIGEMDAEAVQECIPKLMAQLEDSESVVRGIAAWSLGQIGAEEALTPLRRLTIDDTSCHRTANELRLASEAIVMIEGLQETKGEKLISPTARLTRSKSLDIDVVRTGEPPSEAEAMELPPLESIPVDKVKSQPQVGRELEAKIEVTLSKTSFVIGSWNQVEVFLENKGEVPACDCQFVFPSSMQIAGIKGVKIISPGERRTLEASIKPDEGGQLPIEVEAHFQGAGGESRKTTHTVWVEVPPRSKAEEVGVVDHRPTGITAFLPKPEADFQGAGGESRKTTHAVWVEASPRSKVEEVGAVFRRPTGITAFPPELDYLYSNAVFLGKGGFARVFRAKRVADGITVAVKLPLYADGDTGRNFLKEIQTWERLKHRNIVELYDMNILPMPYLETEFLENGNLERVKKPLSAEEAAEIISQITQGVEYAHSKGVLHLDIKPGNILVTRDFVPKLTDWGLARVRGESGYSGDMAFSPLYAAPEQISPSKFGTCDERTDIYQIGVLFYELVTGKTPFNSDDLASVGKAILMDDVTPVSAFNPEATKFEGIIMKCLAKHKEERFQTATELLESLKNHLRETYRTALKESAGNVRRSAYFCGQLFALHARLNEPVEALKYCLDLKDCAHGDLRDELGELAQEIKYRIKEQVPLGEELVSRMGSTAHRIDMSHR